MFWRVKPEKELIEVLYILNSKYYVNNTAVLRMELFKEAYIKTLNTFTFGNNSINFAEVEATKALTAFDNKFKYEETTL